MGAKRQGKGYHLKRFQSFEYFHPGGIIKYEEGDEEERGKQGLRFESWFEYSQGNGSVRGSIGMRVGG